jgi:hypothetical protein
MVEAVALVADELDSVDAGGDLAQEDDIGWHGSCVPWLCQRGIENSFDLPVRSAVTQERQCRK